MDFLFNIWDYITCFFDYIPKVMYFLYAALASCLDAFQLLLRRLVGLDTYWENGVEVSGQDPVLGFINGILGIGDNTSAYSPLRTVFWSLAIFGVIVLAISTMITLIKSHYQEDSTKTSPVGYIYTAVKSVLTFAIVPVVVIAGFWLSTFLLRTLDDITAGRSTEEEIEGVFGSNVSDRFVAANAGGRETYTYFDFFGGGSGSTSETFSGMLFKAAAYDANRVRNGQYADSSMSNFTGLGIFGLDSSIMEGSLRDIVAYQVDYAFANNLNIEGAIHPFNLQRAADVDGVFITITDIDAFAFLGVSNGFSKYNVGLVWYFYNLWKFNFMVGAVGVIVCFGLFVSIILGVMSRLIKSIALFLIYPAVLGLAPLDDFGAFKKWRQEFVQQALMAFGAVIGMNLFFLVLPYLYEIDFFGLGDFNVLNYIFHVLIIVVGLNMIKQFISFLSGLVGGADAASTGDGLKEGVKNSLLKGGALVAGGAGIALKAGKFLSPAGAGLNAAKNAVVKNIARKRAANYASEASTAASDAATLKGAADSKLSGAESIKDTLLLNYINERGPDSHDFEKTAKAEARKRGLVGKVADEYVGQRSRELAEQHMMSHLRDSDTRKQELIKQNEIIANEGFDATTREEYERKTATSEELTGRAKQIRLANYMDENGNNVPNGYGQKLKHEAQGLMGTIQKAFFENIPKNLGINVGALNGIFQNLTPNRYDDKGKIVGRYGGEQRTYHNQDERNELKQDNQQKRNTVFSGLAGAVFGYGGGADTKKADDAVEKKTQANTKAAADASEANLQVSREILKELQKFNRGRP